MMSYKPPDRLTPEAILQGLNTRRLRGPVWYFETLASTNDLAKDLGAQEAPEGALVVAETQTAGRGRLGRHWSSPPSQGLYVSLLLRPFLPPEEVPLITLTAAVAVVRALRRQTGILAGIKWPNDIYLAGKKVGGILSEMATAAERLSYLVVGLGLNVNNPYMPQELDGLATSLARESGRTFCRGLILQSWLEEFEVLYERFLAREFPVILEEWKARTITLGRQVRVVQGLQEIRGLALDVGEDGALLVQRPTGEVVRLTSGEVIPGS
jgi:BirA family biotin operon repressor/biotin-[acetyl-CoA-carboxylase] ligase